MRIITSVQSCFANLILRSSTNDGTIVGRWEKDMKKRFDRAKPVETERAAGVSSNEAIHEDKGNKQGRTKPGLPGPHVSKRS
jgi:hypothetical protein